MPRVRQDPGIRIRYAVNGRDLEDRAIVRCTEFRIGNRTRIFFDPMSLDGTRLGVSDGYDRWRLTRDQLLSALSGMTAGRASISRPAATPR